MTDTQVSAAVGLLGAALGAGAAWWVAVSLARWTRTMDLHREFNSERLSLARSQSFAFLKKHWGMPFGDIASRDEYDLESIPLWEVMYFYQRLWTLVDHRQIVVRVVPELFGEIFIWWYVVVFRQQLQSANWKAAEDIANLYKWMRVHARSDRLLIWTERGEISYDDLRRKYCTRQISGDSSCGAPLTPSPCIDQS